MAYDFQVTFDCADPHLLADWWADALGWDVEPVDESFIRGLIADGQVTENDTVRHNGALVWKWGAAINHPEGPTRAPRILFQIVPEGKTVKNRVHLDVRVGADDVQAVSERLQKRGATYLHDGRQGPNTWVTLADPEGNELCLT